MHCLLLKTDRQTTHVLFYGLLWKQTDHTRVILQTTVETDRPHMCDSMDYCGNRTHMCDSTDNCGNRTHTGDSTDSYGNDFGTPLQLIY